MSDEPNGDAGADEADRLDAYRRKRSADRTTEPFGGEAGGAEGAPPADAPQWSRPRLFCVQKHAARRLHYDFRVELGGVLRSWAVPMGPSLNPADKRLAVQVEDHPVDYADFEGVIPEGNYGAGEVIVWDKGLWIPLEDPEETLPRGKLTFELRGYKLRGAWHLFRTSKKKGEEATKEWMLVKRNDGWASDSRAIPQESIYSGLTLEEIKTGSERAAGVRSELDRLGAPKQPVRAADVKLMLAETGEKPFTDAEWVFELKYDGYRVLAEREDGKARLRYRRGSDATSIYPDVARALRALPFGDLVLDGELVVLDEDSRPSFQRLQKRAQQRRTIDIQRLHPGASGHALRVRPGGVRGIRRALASSARAQAPRAEAAPHGGTHPLPRPHPRTGRSLLRRGEPDPSRGPDRQAGGLTLPRRPLASLAQAACRAHRRLRDRRLHGAPGRAHRIRGVAPRRVRRRRLDLLRAGGKRLHRGAARGASRASRTGST